MKKFLAILIVFAPLFAHADADADLDQISKEENTCLQNNMSEAGMKMCVSDAYLKEDAVLDKVYQDIVTPLKSATDKDSAEILRRLVASERAWGGFRDANCQYAGTTDLGGSNEGLDILSCHCDMTVARIKELRGSN
jgi:uncharacterized protein YecT (DUF1311 family)